MYWIIFVGVLLQTPNTPPRSITEIRRSLNRIDALAKVAVDAKSKELAQQLKDEDNDVRRFRVKFLLKKFVREQLDIPTPLQDAEESLIENAAEDAAKSYDKSGPAKFKLFNKFTDKAFYTVQVNGRTLTVFGVIAPDGYNIIWNPAEQTPETNRAYNESLRPIVPSPQMIFPIPLGVIDKKPLMCIT